MASHPVLGATKHTLTFSPPCMTVGIVFLLWNVVFVLMANVTGLTKGLGVHQGGF